MTALSPAQLAPICENPAERRNGDRLSGAACFGLEVAVHQVCPVRGRHPSADSAVSPGLVEQLDRNRVERADHHAREGVLDLVADLEAVGAPLLLDPRALESPLAELPRPEEVEQPHPRAP